MGGAAAYNRYGYVLSDPVLFVDPMGLKRKSAGARVCCDGEGKFTICWKKKSSIAVFDSCMEQHEKDHIDWFVKNSNPFYCNQCGVPGNLKEKGFDLWEFKSEADFLEFECRGWKVEFDCLKKNFASVPQEHKDLYLRRLNEMKAGKVDPERGWLCDTSSW